MVLGATAVVTVALVAAGIAVLMSLRTNLTEQAQSEANDMARRIALGVATWRGGGARLPLPEGVREGVPVQVTDAEGRLLAVGQGLESISGTGVTAVRMPRTATSPAAPSLSSSASPAPTPTPVASRDDEAADDHGGGHGRGRDRGSDDSGTDDSTADDHGTDDSATPPANDPAIGTISDTVQESSGRAVVDGRSAPYRFATIKATDLGGRTVLVHAGASLAARETAVRSTGVAMLAGLPLVLLVVGGVTWLVTRRALTPVEGIRREMAAITASEDLSRRVPEPASHDEVAQLARTTNETLTALEAAVDRQRRFVADASHELRSPIASLRTQLEVGSAHPQLLDVPGAVKDTERLQQLAADLLLLARLDAGERPGQGRVDLGELVREEVGRRPADRTPVSVDADEGREVAGSRAQLARVIGNLLDNAQRHARAEVTVRVQRQGDRIILTVADDGGGVPAAERERIFERFVRLDDARTRDDGGAGLGLAIARDVARRHGGTLTAGEAPSGGALFELRLPVATAPARAVRYDLH
ncbi:HAMP domain-containing sensor histidine kinase [Streptomyces sp. NPDC002088]|uniref:sensor histidine kinase n=1 Tax=Streptomyces sp. NPDC002088 TaxID=3154665 RepID=UPI003317FEF5